MNEIQYEWEIGRLNAKIAALENVLRNQLIVSLAGNPAMMNATYSRTVAQVIIDQADAIIEKMREGK